MSLERVAIAVSAPLLGIGAAAWLLLHFGQGDGPDATLWSILASQLVWIALAVCGAALAVGAPIAERLGWRRGRLPLVDVGVLLFGFISLSNALHLTLVELALRETGNLGQIDAVVGHARHVAPGLALLSFGLAPAIGEELVFRGLVQRLLASWAGPVAGVVGGALAFGAVHGEWVHGSAAFGLGLYLGCVGWLSDGVRAPMLCHGVNNLLGVSLGLVGGLPRGLGGPPGIALFGLLGAVCLGSVLVRDRRRRGPGGPPGNSSGDLQVSDRLADSGGAAGGSAGDAQPEWPRDPKYS